ncbi:MAG: nickel pincer cofactor biosynthesis protein LarC [Gemmataceae bacterium]
MKVAHFDCFSGISGDMTLAALVDAGVDGEAVRQGVNSLGLPINLEFEKTRRNGIAATYVHVEVPEETTHRFLPEIEQILQRGRLTPKQLDLALRIFRRLGEAEAAVHGTTVDKVHFHEVGALDSIADIAGAAIGLDLLGVDRFTSRSVPTGTGIVKCAHGMMPIPAPATANLLKNVPLATSAIKAELTTPTGAAILTSIVQDWIDSPNMTVERIGHGAGKRDFLEQPNVLRLMVGTTARQSRERQQSETPETTDPIWVLETNLDDLPAEVIGYCYDLLLSAGALDVFSTPIFMKKNRPGVLLSVLTTEVLVPAMEEILFRETTTLGIRRYSAARHKLERKAITVQTQWGPVQGKLAWLEDRPPSFSPEYDDCARIAREHGVPLREVLAAAEEGQRTKGEGQKRQAE